MRISSLAALSPLLAAASAQVSQGFNYGSVYTDQSPITEAGYEAQFRAAQNLAGNSAFSSARLFTSIQAGTTNTPSDAFQAAVNTRTPLLLGLWASAGQANIDNEIAALRSAINNLGSQFTDLIVAISVGSEDLYRISPTGIENLSGIGAGPDEVADYIGQVKQAFDLGKPVGHVDTWTAWVNGSNSAVISASDFIGMDAYPYFQTTMANDIGSAASLFFSAYDQTVSAAAGKPVWVTETGWPVSGETENLAEANTANAKRYWDEVGCGRLFGKINTWWFTLQDAFPTAPSPSFGIVGAGSSTTDVPTTGLFDLTCGSTSENAPSSSVNAASANAAPSQQAAGNNGAQRQNVAEGGVGTGSNGASSGSAPAGDMPSGSSGTGQTQAGGSAAPPETKPEESSDDAQTPAEDSTATQAEHPPATNAPQPPASGVQPTTLITKTTAVPGSSASASGCPASLSGQFEYPHLIVPVNKDDADKAYGTSFNGTISASTSSIFNFDFPIGLEHNTCTLVFLLPKQTDLFTSAFTLSGSGGIDVTRLIAEATEQTTFNNQPAVNVTLPSIPSVEPGNEYVFASGRCFAGQRKAYKLSATGSLDLNYFQNYNPSPIGLFITVC